MLKRILIAGIAALSLAGGAFWMMRGESLPPSLSMAATAQETSTSSEAAMVPDMILGKIDAPVEMIEYASFTCPHCAHFHADVYPQLKKNYIDTGKVKFIYREVYFDKFGLWAAMVARCARPEKYFPIADMVFDTQKDWIGDGKPETISENLRKIGLKAGLTKEALDACLNDNDMAKAMVATYQTNATKDEINSTPSFVINGQKYSNMSYDDLAKLLDEKLAN